MATSGIRCKLREVQRVGEDESEAVPTTTVDVIELARDGVEMNPKYATMSSRQTDLEANLEDIRAAGCNIHS